MSFEEQIMSKDKYPSIFSPQMEGVSNGLCEHLRACDQCVYFYEHEQ